MYTQMNSEQVNPCSVTCSPAAIPPTSLFLSTARVRSVSADSHNNPTDCQSELLPQSRGRQQLRLLVSTPHQLPVASPPCCRKRLYDVTDTMSTLSSLECLSYSVFSLVTIWYLFTLLLYCFFLILAMTKLIYGAHTSDCLQESLDS